MNDKTASNRSAVPTAEGSAAELASISIKDAPTGEAEGTHPTEASTAHSRTPEQEVALDMLKRSVFFAVPLTAAATIGWQWEGLASAALALVLVLVNLMLGAAAITVGARVGGNALMAAVLGGYVLRLGIITIAVVPIAHHDWFQPLPFAVSLLVSHLGLLAVECRHVSLSAAYPGLKPPAGENGPRSSGNPWPGSSDSFSFNSLSLQSRERMP